MLFSEIYSAYYNTVASIIACAQEEKLDSDSLYELVKKSAFPDLQQVFLRNLSRFCIFQIMLE